MAMKQLVTLCHQDLISSLTTPQLLNLHKICCRYRGKDWYKKDMYVFDYEPDFLIAYHFLVMKEIFSRDRDVETVWTDPKYRGEEIPSNDEWCDEEFVKKLYFAAKNDGYILYPEHDKEFYDWCINEYEITVGGGYYRGAGV